MVAAKGYLAGKKSRLLGPNCPGVISPGKCKIGIMPAYIHRPGSIGVISRSGTLIYEAVDQLTRVGLGQSTCVGVGGDPITGLSFVEVLELFSRDPQTEAVILVGEIGGASEEEAAGYIRTRFGKPVVAFIAGQNAPPGRRMGHAGAVISGGRGSAKDKMEALRAAGATVVENPAEMGLTMLRVLKERREA
jgi:succinyl-CoA synthetase alpha subunit